MSPEYQCFVSAVLTNEPESVVEIINRNIEQGKRAI